MRRARQYRWNYCHECGARATHDVIYCPRCGLRMPHASDYEHDRVTGEVRLKEVHMNPMKTLGIICLAIAGVLALVLLVPPAAPPRQAAAAAVAPLSHCAQEMKQEKDAGVLYGIDFSSGVPRIYVGPNFYEYSIGAKRVFARNLACFLVESSKNPALGDFLLYDSKTDKPVAAYSDGRLTLQ